MNAGLNRPAPPTAQTLAERLRTNLAAQTASATELEALLTQERERLMARDWEAILQLTQDKERLIQRLQSQGRELEQLAAGQPLATVIENAGLTPAKAALHDQAARLQRANRESRALFDHHQSRVGTALRLLNRGDNAGTYGRSGYTGAGRLSQRIAQA